MMHTLSCTLVAGRRVDSRNYGNCPFGSTKKRCMVNCFSLENCCHKVLSAIEGFFIVKPPVSVYAIASNFSFSFRSQLHCNKNSEVEIHFMTRI